MSNRLTIFIPGAKIKSVSALLGHIKRGHWIYWRDRPKHPTILYAMTLRTLDYAAKNGIMRGAIRRRT